MAINAKTYSTSGSTNAIHTGPIKVNGFTLSNTTADAATITIYNALTAAGAVVLTETVAGNTSVIRQLPSSVYASVGVSVAITGTTPNVVGSVLLD